MISGGIALNRISFSICRISFAKLREDVMRWLIWSAILILSGSHVFAADGFREFDFGESPDEIQKVGRAHCSFGKIEKHTRWEWIKRVDCKGYRFKGKTKARLFFEFSDDELVKVFVVSRVIKDYFLIRYPEFNYRLPLKSPSNHSSISNLADKLILKDKVHRLGDEYRYTTFHYAGKWEWEYMYERKGNPDDERRRRIELLEDEEESGVGGWDKFKFKETEEAIKDKLAGMCSNIKVLSGSDLGSVTCDDFTFLEKKIGLLFFFDDEGLVKIELKLTPDWYPKLLPLLKRKYGLPFLELKENELFFPAIEFPKANVALAHKKDGAVSKDVWLALKYIRQGYEDTDQTTIRQKLKSKPDRAPRSKSEKILDSI
jgi:hypothetical protein